MEGANRNDFKMARATIASIPVERPAPTAEKPQGMCLDKGYDYREVRELLPRSPSPPTSGPGAKRPRRSRRRPGTRLVVGSWSGRIAGSTDTVRC